MNALKITFDYDPEVEYHNYPVFVYGTLRIDGGNHRNVLGGYWETMEPVLVPGMRMQTSGRGSVPFAEVGTAEDRIVTEKYTIPDAKWEAARERLDMLEGFRGVGQDNLYERALIEFTDAHGTPHKGWIYSLPLPDEADGASRRFYGVSSDRIVVDWTADKLLANGIQIKDDSWTREHLAAKGVL